MRQDWFEELKAKMESPEGIAKITAYIKNLEQKTQIYDKQLERFYKKIDTNSFEEFVSKISHKYDSEEYRDKWYKLRVEPPEFWKFFLYDFAKQYGVYNHEFESNDVFGYRFWKIYGQGCFVDFEKINYNK